VLYSCTHLATVGVKGYKSGTERVCVYEGDIDVRYIDAFDLVVEVTVNCSLLLQLGRQLYDLCLLLSSLLIAVSLASHLTQTTLDRLHHEVLPSQHRHHHRSVSATRHLTGPPSSHSSSAINQ